MYFPQRMSKALQLLPLCHRLKLIFFTQLTFTTMKLLKVIAGIHNEKVHIYWTGEYIEIK